MNKEVIEKVKNLDLKISQYNRLLEEIEGYRWEEFKNFIEPFIKCKLYEVQIELDKL